MPEKPKLLKHLFNEETAQTLAQQITRIHPTFPTKKFLQDATKNLQTLEMTPRIHQFTQALKTHLPTDYPTTLKILITSLPPAQTTTENINGDWTQWPIAHYIATYGLEHPELSIPALTEITTRFTAEFAIRPYLIQNQKQTLTALKKLTKHPNPHIRRWTSEGTRPRLPWGAQIKTLIQDPTPILPILKTLKNDPELYVRRSVANSLNDITKDHPSTVIDLCKTWQKQNPNDPNTTWLIKHALRTLIKKSHPAALTLLGYPPPKNLTTTLSLTPTTLPIGQKTNLTLTLTNNSPKPQNLLIDYTIHHQKKNGTHTPKTFKWKTLTIPPNTTINLTKTHPFKQTTTRTLYPGPQKIQTQINGQKSNTTTIHLT